MVFDNLKDAETLSNKCHNWLIENCPKYCAIIWIVPVKDPKAELYFVEIPQEYPAEIAKKALYTSKTELVKTVELEVAKVSIAEKLPNA